MYYHRSINRTMCDVLEDARNSLKTLNLSPMAGLLEEIQIMSNRMESALYDQKDYKQAMEEYKDIKEEIKKLRAELKKLKKESGVGE